MSGTPSTGPLSSKLFNTSRYQANLRWETSQNSLLSILGKVQET